MDADKGRMVFKSEPVSMSLEPDWQVMRREGGGSGRTSPALVYTVRIL